MKYTFTYVLDTCALIDLCQRVYPPQLFPELHEFLDDHVEHLVVPRDCFNELRRDSPARRWVEQRREQVLMEVSAEISRETAHVMRKAPSLVRTRANRRTGNSAADPLLIATALALGGSAAVVTKEKHAGPLAKHIHVPDACAAVGVKCLSVLGFIADLMDEPLEP